jgi:hypothetical protein
LGVGSSVQAFLDCNYCRSQVLLIIYLSVYHVLASNIAIIQSLNQPTALTPLSSPPLDTLKLYSNIYTTPRLR